MSVTKQITIGCENCARWEQLGGFEGSSVKSAREALKGWGWSSKRRGGKILDYCPKCSAITDKYKRRKPPQRKKRQTLEEFGKEHFSPEFLEKAEVEYKIVEFPPGSDKAADQGCHCPRMDNEYGKGLGGLGEKFGWVISELCPIHGAKK